MSFNTLYQGKFLSQQVDIDNNDDQKEVTINIYDTLSGESDDPTETIPLEMAENPLTATVIDNDEDKLTSKRSKQYTINIHSSDSIGIETFIEGGDNRFYVEILVLTQVKFRGWLSVADIQEEFLPDPNVITLTATDGLGFLEDEPLVTEDDVNPQNEHELIDFIRWSLRKTGYERDIYVCMNGREKFASPLNKEGQDPLNAEAIFFAPGSGNKVRVDDTVDWFYIGQKFTVTDAGTNTGPFTVTNIVHVGTDFDVFVTETVDAFAATSPGPGATFTDITPSGHFYKYCSVNAKTFEAEIGVSENCATVLEKILKPGCFISQINGDWFIMLEDEFRDGGVYYVFRFDKDGNVVEKLTMQYIKNIGIDETMVIIDDDMIVSADQPRKTITTTFNYNYPSEIPCNRDFSRGTGADPTGAPSETIDYTLDCWQFLREGTTPAGLDSAPFSGSVGVLRKLFELNYEKERYLVNRTAGGFRHYFKSEGIEMRANDKINIGFSYRFNTDESTVIVSIAHMRLVGDDGFVYDWQVTTAGVSSWVQKLASATVFDTEWEDDVTGLDNREWKNVSAESKPAPVSGILYIRLLNAVAPPVERWFSDLQVTHIPFINGSYQKYKAQTHTVINQVELKAKAKREDTVFISDAPNTLMKGALLKLNSAGRYVLTEGFYDAAAFPNADYPNSDYVKPYGEMQAFWIFNQYNRVMRKFDGHISQLEMAGVKDDIPDLHHKYYLTDPNTNTVNKVFQLLHFEQDYDLCEWNGFFVQVDNSGEPWKVYLGHTFKYITE